MGINELPQRGTSHSDRAGDETVIDPTIPICDAHHHLWNRPDQRYLLGEFLADAITAHKVRSTVFVEWRSHYRESGPVELRSLGETEFAAAVGQSTARSDTRVCAAIVGYVDLTLGAAAAAILEAHIIAGGGRFKGVRSVGTWDADSEVVGGPPICVPGLYRDRCFREGFSRLEHYGLSFDAWVYQTQLDDLIDLARAFPQTRIVLNHTGGVLGIGPYAGRRDELFSAWRHSLQELSRSSNVFLKLGGLGMRRSGFAFYGAPREASSKTVAESWRPWLETAIELFGTERCMFESNFPVDGASCSYRVLWNAFKRVLTGASWAEKTQLLHDTAVRFYGIEPT
jgi:L-fuconolactonase